MQNKLHTTDLSSFVPMFPPDKPDNTDTTLISDTSVAMSVVPQPPAASKEPLSKQTCPKIDPKFAQFQNINSDHLTSEARKYIEDMEKQNERDDHIKVKLQNLVKNKVGFERNAFFSE